MPRELGDWVSGSALGGQVALGTDPAPPDRSHRGSSPSMLRRRPVIPRCCRGARLMETPHNRSEIGLRTTSCYLDARSQTRGRPENTIPCPYDSTQPTRKEPIMFPFVNSDGRLLTVQSRIVTSMA